MAQVALSWGGGVCPVLRVVLKGHGRPGLCALISACGPPHHTLQGSNVAESHSPGACKAHPAGTSGGAPQTCTDSSFKLPWPRSSVN
jgi:hypothetical protein